MTIEKRDILIVEDDTDFAGLLVGYLNKKGFSVEHVNTTQEAIVRLPIVEPEIILLDYMLPDGLGTKVERYVRSHPNLFKYCCIIYETAVEDEVDLAQLGRHQSSVLVKPYKPEDLWAKVTAAKMQLQALRSKSGLGLMGLEAFKREIDYRFMRKEFAEGVIFSPIININPELLVKDIKQEMLHKEYYESSIYDLGNSTFGCVLVEKSFQPIVKGLCERLRIKPEDLANNFVLSAIDLKDVDATNFDLTKVLQGLYSKMRSVRNQHKQDETAVRLPIGWKD